MSPSGTGSGPGYDWTTYRLHLHLASAETLLVGEGRVRADENIVGLRNLYCFVHDREVSIKEQVSNTYVSDAQHRSRPKLYLRSVKPAGHIGEVDRLHKCFVVALRLSVRESPMLWKF